jgi:hypothetical protein
MKRNNLALLIIVLLSVAFLSLGFLILNDKDVKCPPVQECEECVCEEDKKETTNVINSVGANNPTFLYGVIEKEEIPEELELGDYWYWMYFEKPLLLVNNASGSPMYVDKIQLTPPENKDFYDIEGFVGKKVEAYGYQTWGYAESSVFQVSAIREY